MTNYYGATREEWRPFGGNQTIDQVLGGIKNQLNGIPRATAIRWASVEEELFADDRKLIEQAAVQLSGPHLWPYGERAWAARFRWPAGAPIRLRPRAAQLPHSGPATMPP